MTSILGDWNLGGGVFTGKGGGGIFRIFPCKENEEKEKRERNERKKNRKRIEKTKMGGGEQARVPNLSQLNLQGPGASAALLVTTHYGLRKSGFKNTPGNRPLLRSENFY